MHLSQQEVANIANRDFILGNTTVEEQIDFIIDQIKHPFDSGDSNYFKKLAKMVNEDKLDAICLDLFRQIENVYPHFEVDVENTDAHISEYFEAVYKFFVRNIQKLTRIFLREYIVHSAKHRKNLVEEYMDAKIPNYPKEQYGTKEFYILITKMPSIVRDVFENDIRLEKFIDYIERADKHPLYFKVIRDMLDRGILIDYHIVSDIYEQFRDSDQYDRSMCKLQMTVTDDLINPYLEDNGLMDLKNPPIMEMEDDDVDGEDDDDDDSNIIVERGPTESDLD